MTASILDVDQSTADAPVYTIRSLDDFAKIPPKRLGACLLDFRAAIDTAREIVALLREMDPNVAWPLSVFQWRDDGERGELRDMVFHLPNGERVSLRALQEQRRQERQPCAWCKGSLVAGVSGQKCKRCSGTGIEPREGTPLGEQVDADG